MTLGIGFVEMLERWRVEMLGAETLGVEMLGRYDSGNVELWECLVSGNRNFGNWDS